MSYSIMNHSHSNKENAGRGVVPRLALINSIAGYGRCSTTIALPVISALGVQACPVPTSVLSNHLAFPVYHFQDYTPYMREYIHVWRQLDFAFDGLYCGFLGSVEQISIVEEFLSLFQPEFFLLDPVMGDHGRTYSTITKEHCVGMRNLAAQADILTPNLTEACLLTETDYHENLSERELSCLCEKLRALCPQGHIVITGMQEENCFLNVILEQGNTGSDYTLHRTPKAGEPRHGTGDLFASVLAADALCGREFSASVQRAADFIALCIKGSEESCIPEKDGIIFERYLRTLILAP